MKFGGKTAVVSFRKNGELQQFVGHAAHCRDHGTNARLWLIRQYRRDTAKAVRVGKA